MEIKNKTALTDMAASILRPLIKVLMSHEFTHSELTELVRKSYVEVAYDGFSLPDKRMTYSRAAILTGLSRKEVVRHYGNILQAKIEHNAATNHLLKHAMRAVHGWLSDYDFMDVNKSPNELPITETSNCFEKLVDKYCGQVDYEAVLAELNRLGVTSTTCRNTVKLLHKGFIPQQDELEKIRIMSICVSDLFNTAVHSTETNNGDIRFQRQLVYSGIEEALAQRFHEAGSEKAMALFDTLNDFLSVGREQADPLLRKTGKRVGLGIYYFEGASQVQSVKMTSEEHA